MKNSQNKKTAPSTDQLLCGVYSKREAVLTIEGGCRHIHSTVLGTRDPAAKLTQNALALATVPTYPWEPANPATLQLGKSVDRSAIIQQVIDHGRLEKKRFLREKISIALEELITNALYHSYRTPAGEEKYSRRSEVTLKSDEVVAVEFQLESNGVYLAVTDQGGSLTFEDVASSLWRCYQSGSQIENKESGAGLGTYMVFDAVTHFKIVTTPGHGAKVSCWIADQRSYDPDAFSFNFFERRNAP